MPLARLELTISYTSPTPVVSLHLIPRIQQHPGIPVTLLTGSSLLLFLEPQQKTPCVCHLSIFSSLLISCMPVSALMAIIHTLFSDNKRNSIICDPWLGHCSLGILKKYLCDKSKGHRRGTGTKHERWRARRKCARSIFSASKTTCYPLFSGIQAIAFFRHSSYLI